MRRPGWDVKMSTIQNGVHVIGSIYPSLTVVVETTEGVLLFDAPYEEGGQEFKDSLIELGVPFEGVKEVFITHAHFDRLWGINKIREFGDVTVSVGKEDCEAIRSFDSEKLHVLDTDTEYRSGTIVVDRELRGGERFEFGDTTVDVIACPGHTPGSVCYLVTKDGKRILVAGDVIGSFKYGPEIFPVMLSPRFGGDADAYLKTVESLMAMEPPDILLTGHPSLMTTRQSFAIEGQWQSFLQPGAGPVGWHRRTSAA